MPSPKKIANLILQQESKSDKDHLEKISQEQLLSLFTVSPICLKEVVNILDSYWRTSLFAQIYSQTLATVLEYTQSAGRRSQVQFLVHSNRNGKTHGWNSSQMLPLTVNTPGYMHQWCDSVEIKILISNVCFWSVSLTHLLATWTIGPIKLSRPWLYSLLNGGREQ